MSSRSLMDGNQASTLSAAAAAAAGGANSTAPRAVRVHLQSLVPLALDRCDRDAVVELAVAICTRC